MPPGTDVENRSGSSERTPLLQSEPTADEHEQAALLEPQPEPKTKSWYAWRLFWALLAAAVLGIFIKGWIDADDVDFDLKGALKRALGGGLSGAAAMVLQVLTLMPLRTIMNYQYRHGTSFTTATRTLYQDGGIRRYYQGIGPALVQGPVSRFGDTAANAGILALLQSNSYLSKLPTPIKTVFASACAAGFRMILTPIDTLKTTLQAQGARGTALLRQRIKTDGIGSLWWGALATAAATFVGHYPWFATYNYLSEVITEPPKHPLFWWLLRLAFIGFCASIVSDSISNSLRVVKTYRQVNDTKIGRPPRRNRRSLWAWTQDQNFGKRPARIVVLDLVEDFLRPLGKEDALLVDQSNGSGHFASETNFAFKESRVDTSTRGGRLQRHDLQLVAIGHQYNFSIYVSLAFLTTRSYLRHQQRHCGIPAMTKNPIAAFQAGVEDKLGFISTEFINWQGYVLAFSWGVWAFETYLMCVHVPSTRYRQFPNYSRPHPPTALKSHFTDEVFKKSQRYGKDKAKFGLVSKLYSQLLETALIVFGAFPWAWKVSGNLLAKFGYGPEYEITHSIAFGTVLFYLNTLPSLPVSLYSTFVLEEKHGFNKMTFGLYVADTLKGWAVGFAIGAPFMAAFLKIVDWAGQKLGTNSKCRVAFQLIMVVLYPTVIQPLFNKLSPLETGALRTRIEALASRLSFPLTDLYVIDGSKRSAHSNAYFYGLPWSKHIVLFDTLIKKSQPAELEAVLAHELGHWKYSFGFPIGPEAKPPVLVSFLLYQMVITPIESVVGFLLNALSRRFEYQADQFACELDAQGLGGEKEEGKTEEESTMRARLGRALVALHAENLSTVWVDWMYSAYHHSHPTLTERLRAMDAYALSQNGRPKVSLEPVYYRPARLMNAALNQTS
ncbi:metalloendopeptidase [Rhizoctonia solani AG-1 IA]|uniref:Ste24 endopeptidase n=1 Tax=Thanatephorus cucumeris (strain AG1-IA) TaxID=983506 RepID=L8WQN7_THACA|nr:metalloendopeptidase [Rhizoctonia solani AG-1 IA]